MILFVGRCEHRKGLHILLESLDYMQHQATLVIAGPSSYNDKYSQTVSELILKKTREHRIVRLGRLTEKELVGWYQKASLFVCPSLIEPFGNVCAEALACATPVVASNVDGIPDIVTNYENGILVPPGNPQELAKAIEYLMDNPKLRERLGRRGRIVVEDRFALAITLKKLLRIYDEAVRLHSCESRS